MPDRTPQKIRPPRSISRTNSNPATFPLLSSAKYSPPCVPLHDSASRLIPVQIQMSKIIAPPTPALRPLVRPQHPDLISPAKLCKGSEGDFLPNSADLSAIAEGSAIAEAFFVCSGKNRLSERPRMSGETARRRAHQFTAAADHRRGAGYEPRRWVTNKPRRLIAVPSNINGSARTLTARWQPSAFCSARSERIQCSQPG